MTKKRPFFPMIDAAKLLCAVLVVAIHSFPNPAQSPVGSEIVRIFAGLAVPFFLIASGFLLGNKIYGTENPEISCFNSAKKWMLLYLAWAALWLPSLVLSYGRLYQGISPVRFALIMFRRIFVAGQGVYWFLLVLAETALVLGIFAKYRKMKWFYTIGAVGMLLGLSYDCGLPGGVFDLIHKLFYTVFSWSNNLIMKGIPYFTIGCLFSRIRCSTDVPPFLQKRNIYLTALLAVTGVLALLPGSVHSLSSAFYPVQAAALFGAVLFWGECGIPPKRSVQLRSMSSAIYFLHTVIIYWVLENIFQEPLPPTAVFVLSLTGSLGIAIWISKGHSQALKQLIGVR